MSVENADEQQNKPSAKRRLTPEERLDRIKAHILTLENRAAGLRAKEAIKARKLDTHRKAILGGAAMALMQNDAALKAKIGDYVRENSTSKQREAVEDLI